MFKSVLVLFSGVAVFLVAGYQSVETGIDGGDFTCDTQKLHDKSCVVEVPGCAMTYEYCLEGAAPDRVKLCTTGGGLVGCWNTNHDPDCIGGPNQDTLSSSSCVTPTAGGGIE